MTSKIVVNNIESDAGVSTVFFNSDIGGTGGTLNVDGNLNVDGVLSYEDVTNIDSVGLITARSGLHVTGGLLGVGTNNPDRALSVSDQSNGNLARFIGPTNNLFIMNDRSRIIDLNSSGTGDHLCLGTQNTERLRITSAGKVGIGTDNPNSAAGLDVLNGEICARGIRSNAHKPIAGVWLGKATGGNALIEIVGDNNSTAEIDFTSPNTDTKGRVGYDLTSDYMYFYTNGANERLRVDSAGRLMLGTTTEGFATYGDNLTIADSGHCGMTIRSGTSSYGTIYFSDGDDGSADEVRGFIDYNHSNNQLQLGTDGATRMRIGNDGKFYYATTSQGPHGGFFNINASNSGRNGINVQGTSANYVMVSSAGGSSGDHIHFSNYSNNNQETGRIKDNQSNVTYYTSSDYRLKDNIVPIADGITRVKQLNPVRHTWINNPALGTVDGWIAHELDEVCPDAVDGEKDAVREDGSIKAQAADYGRITPLLAAALKEAIAKIEALEARVTTLEGS